MQLRDTPSLSAGLTGTDFYKASVLASTAYGIDPAIRRAPATADAQLAAGLLELVDQVFGARLFGVDDAAELARELRVHLVEQG